ncbi:hypothetical protein [Rahnella aquatilis]|nr:hypothetical protein [Rahnella aquatilis]KFD03149.1 hypothetical protein GRAQ_02795 [Rahnella aquatilis CIP 78.65 = ATCC 33071]
MKKSLLMLMLTITFSCFAHINEDIEYSRDKYLLAYKNLNTKLEECLTEMKSLPFITSADIKGFDKRTVSIAVLYLGTAQIDQCAGDEHHQFMIRAFDYYAALTEVSVYSQQIKTLHNDIFALLPAGNIRLEREYESFPLKTRTELEARLKNKNLRSYPSFQSSPQYDFDDK